MDLDPEQIVADVRAGGLLVAGRPVLVLVSGGRDSTCLLDVAVRVAGGGAVSALHVDYGLRPASAEDAAAVAALCDRLGVALRTERARVPERAGNLQAWARDVRYGMAARLALRRGARVAVGHTATDQAETVLYRLAASPGRRALLGMPARDGLLVRPLLAFTRAQTGAYCRARGLAWREDASNHAAAYTRARVRNDLVPALRGLHPAAEANVVRTAAELRDEAEALDAVVDSVLEGRDRLELARLAALPAALRRLVVRRLAEVGGGAAVAARAAARADELLELGARGGSVSLDLGGGMRALVEYGVLRFADGQTASAAPVSLPVPGEVAFGDWTVMSERVVPAARDGFLDAATLGGPLVVRCWRPGDRMAPLGLGGTRTLADLFTDRRVPREARRAVPMVEAAGEIAWVPGVATGERFRVTAATRQAVRLTARTVA